MKCKQIELKIVAHITEGEPLLPAEDAHIQACLSCKTYLAEMDTIFREAENSVELPTDAYFSSLWARVEPRLGKQSAILRFFQMPIVVQSIAASLLIAFGFFANTWVSQNKTPQQKPVADMQLQRLLQQSEMAITSFASMDEYEQVDMLAVLTVTADTLLATTVQLKDKYANDPEFIDVLSNIERVLIMLSSMEGKSPATIRTFQYGVQENRVVEKIGKLSI